jgi:hypothetical protein
LSYGLSPSIAKQASTEADVHSKAKADPEVKTKNVFYQRLDMTPVKPRSVYGRKDNPKSDFEVEVFSWKSLISRTECILGYSSRSQHRRQMSLHNSKVKAIRCSH